MGRRAKYATLRKYQPYIDVICKDLGIPEDAYILVEFTNVKKRRTVGTAIYYKGSKYGEVKVSKHYGHAETLRILMHEFRHIQQYATGRLKDFTKELTWGDRTLYANFCLWDGIEYRDYTSRSKQHNQAYLDSPWEVDADAYEKQLYRLFPGCRIPVISPRVLIGEIGNVKFYRERS